MAALETLAWRMWGARTSGEDLVAQAVKIVTAGKEMENCLRGCLRLAGEGAIPQ